MTVVLPFFSDELTLPLILVCGYYPHVILYAMHVVMGDQLSGTGSYKCQKMVLSGRLYLIMLMTAHSMIQGEKSLAIYFPFSSQKNPFVEAFPSNLMIKKHPE